MKKATVDTKCGVRTSSLSKEQLLEKMATYEKALKEEFSLFFQHKKDLIADITLMGGALVIGYMVVRRRVGSSNVKEGELSSMASSQQPTTSSSAILPMIADALVTEILIVSLTMLKERLVDHLHKINLKEGKKVVAAERQSTEPQ